MTDKKYNKVEPNQKKAKQEVDANEIAEQVKEVQAQRVVKNAPKKTKKGLIERATIALIGPDGLPRVGRYISKEVLAPAVKDFLWSSIQTAASMLIFKNDDPGYRGYEQQRNFNSYSSRPQGHTTNYRGVSSRPSNVHRDDRDRRDDRYRDPEQAQQLRPGTILADWVLQTRDDAVRVHEALRDLAYQYSKVKVGNYYELIGVSTVYTDYDYGWAWDDIENVRIKPVRNGFILELPPIQAI